MLRVGDLVTYKNAAQYAATLRSDGQLQRGATTFNTLSLCALHFISRFTQLRVAELYNVD